jgi:uncharacterized protein
MFNRRQFFETAIGAAAASGLKAQPSSQWGGPVLDVHFHTRPDPEANLLHIQGCGVTRAVLLTRVTAEDQAKAALGKHPDRFVRFTSADVTRPDAIDLLRKSVKGGAIGLGEIKFHVPLDGGEMRRLYELAAELDVPVTVHFQEVQHFEGEGAFSTGFSRLPAVLKAYPRTTFIGHADCFWANISADVPGDIAYPSGKVKPGGLSDRMLSDFPNLFADLSANSGRNALAAIPILRQAFLPAIRTSSCSAATAVAATATAPARTHRSP